MKSSPAGLQERVLPSTAPDLPRIDPTIARAEAREVLGAQSLPAHPDASTLAHVLDAPAVASNRTMELVAVMAAGAALPGCDAGTVVCSVLGGGVVLLGLLGGTAYGVYQLGGATKNLESNEVGFFVRSGPLGWLAGKLGKDPRFMHEGSSAVYNKFFYRFEGGFKKTTINFPIAESEKGSPRSTEGGGDYKRVFPSAGGKDAAGNEVVGNIPHTFTWSARVIPIDGQEWLFYKNFAKKASYSDMSEKVYDASQKAVSDVVAAVKFRDLPDANDKKAQINELVQRSKHLADFSAEYGANIIVVLGDIQAPSSLIAKAEESAAIPYGIKLAEGKVKIAENEGKAQVARAEADAKATEVRAAALTGALKARVTELGITEPSDRLKLVGINALEGLAPLIIDKLVTAPRDDRHEPHRESPKVEAPTTSKPDKK